MVLLQKGAMQGFSVLTVCGYHCYSYTSFGGIGEDSPVVVVLLTLVLVSC